MSFLTVKLYPDSFDPRGVSQMADNVLFVCDTTDGPITISLPEETNAEGMWVFYNSGAGSLTVDGREFESGKAGCFLNVDGLGWIILSNPVLA